MALALALGPQRRVFAQPAGDEELGEGAVGEIVAPLAGRGVDAASATRRGALVVERDERPGETVTVGLAMLLDPRGEAVGDDGDAAVVQQPLVLVTGAGGRALDPPRPRGSVSTMPAAVVERRSRRPPGRRRRPGR
ncbi:MAG: hypothetical protein R3F65_17695 [bacterium]